MIAGSRLNGSAYIWTDKKGNKHIIDLGTRIQNSEISFLDETDTRLYYSIPTIQNVSFNQSVTLPSHPTLNNSYIQQFAKEQPPKINFDIILAESLFTNFDVLSEDGSVEQRDLTTDEFIAIQSNDNVSVDDILTNKGMYSVKDLIGIFEDIKNNRRVFTLTTNLQMNELLDNLVITSISYVADKDSREIVACSLEAERVNFAEIDYVTMDAAEVNGLMVNSADGSTSSTDVYGNYTLNNDGDQAFDDTWYEDVENYIFFNNTDLRNKFGDALRAYCDKVGMDFPIHYIMTDEINRNGSASPNFIYSFRFPSDYGINTTGATQSTQRGAAYEFFTNKIKISFSGQSERKIVNIYLEAYTSTGSDIADIVDEGAKYFPLRELIDVSGNKIKSVISDTTKSFNNGWIDRETGLYDLVESYPYLGIDYNTQTRLKYKDVNSVIDASGRFTVKNNEVVSELTTGELTVKDLYIQGYKICNSYPPLVLSFQGSDSAYSNSVEIKQAAEIDWKFGVLEVPYDIHAGFQSILDNKKPIISYWQEKLIGKDKTTVPVHYGVLFVGAKLVIIFFNSKIMNDRTITKTNAAVK